MFFIFLLFTLAPAFIRIARPDFPHSKLYYVMVGLILAWGIYGGGLDISWSWLQMDILSLTSGSETRTRANLRALGASDKLAGALDFTHPTVIVSVTWIFLLNWLASLKKPKEVTEISRGQ